MGKIAKWTFLIISISCFLTSLSQIAFYVSDDPVESKYALTCGWYTLFIGDLASYSWIANPLIFFSWIIYALSRKSSLIFSSLATLFAVSFLFFDKVITNEGGIPMEITQYGSGYFLWLSSCIAIFIGSFLLNIQSKMTNKINDTF